MAATGVGGCLLSLRGVDDEPRAKQEARGHARLLRSQRKSSGSERRRRPVPTLIQKQAFQKGTEPQPLEQGCQTWAWRASFSTSTCTATESHISSKFKGKTSAQRMELSAAPHMSSGGFQPATHTRAAVDETCCTQQQGPKQTDERIERASFLQMIGLLRMRFS